MMVGKKNHGYKGTFVSQGNAPRRTSSVPVRVIMIFSRLRIVCNRSSITHSTSCFLKRKSDNTASSTQLDYSSGIYRFVPDVDRSPTLADRNAISPATASCFQRYISFSSPLFLSRSKSSPAERGNAPIY